MNSAHFSPIMMEGALVLPLEITGMIEASATLRPSMPWTFSFASTTAMGSFSPVHWLLVIVVILLVFGPTKLASVGKGLGQGIRNFKKGISGESDKDALSDEEAEEPKRLDKRRDKVPRRRVS